MAMIFLCLGLMACGGSGGGDEETAGQNLEGTWLAVLPAPGTGTITQTSPAEFYLQIVANPRSQS